MEKAPSVDGSSAKPKKRSKSKPKKSKEEKEVVRTVTFEAEDLGGNEHSGEVRLSPLDVPSLEGASRYAWTKRPGTVFEGTLEGSAMTGKGKLTWPDGSFYEGTFQGGYRHGQGVYVWKDGVTKSMTLKKGLLDETFSPSNELTLKGSFLLYEAKAKHSPREE